MFTGSYTYSTLEKKYDNFFAPNYEITVGTKKLDNATAIVTELIVDITAGLEAGGCTFTIEALYDFEKSTFDNAVKNAIAVGEKIKIKTGYIKKEEVFLGYVDQVSFEYPDDGPPRIRVEGIDAKGFLMNSNSRFYLNKTSITDACKKIMNNCVSKGYAKSLKMGMLNGYTAELIQNDIDDYRFLVHIAEMQGISFFVVNGEIIFDDVMSNTSSIITLDYGKSLLSFTKTLSLYKQIGKFIVYSVDPKTGKSIKGESDKVSVSGTGDTSVGTASKFKSLEEIEYNFLVQTDAECKRLAQARLDARAIDYVSGEGKCVGLPELIPGRYIEVKGMDSKTSGKYFINSVRHTYGQEGYITTFTVKGAKSK